MIIYFFGIFAVSFLLLKWFSFHPMKGEMIPVPIKQILGFVSFVSFFLGISTGAGKIIGLLFREEKKQRIKPRTRVWWGRGL